MHVNEDGTTTNAKGGHFANRYMGRDDARETPWGVAELKPEPRVSRAKGEAGLNGYGSRKTYCAWVTFVLYYDAMKFSDGSVIVAHHLVLFLFVWFR